jgi:hypothetical protein
MTQINPTREKSKGYHVIIEQTKKDGAYVVGKLSEVQVEFASDYVPLVDPEPGKFSQWMEVGSMYLPKSWTGGRPVTTRFQSVSIARYNASQFLTLPIRLEFVTYNDPLSDVVTPCKNLHMMAVPGMGAIKGTLGRPEPVMVSIGRIIRLTEAVITSVSVSFSAELVIGSNGEALPAKASADITVQATKLFMQQDVKDMYNVGGGKG